MTRTGHKGGRAPRVYVSDALVAGGELTLDRERSHHLVDVLRLCTGARLVLFDGHGQDWPARLVDASRQVRLQIEAPVANEAESPLTIALWQGLSQGARMDACLRQSVELGMADFRPLSTARNKVRLDAQRAAKKRAHWQAIAVSAAEQCGRARVPQVHPLDTLQASLRALDVGRATSGALALVLEPDAPATLGSVLPGDAPTRIDLLIGPESGLADEEIAHAIRAGFTPVRAGPRTLRTETAGPAAIAILQARFGDLLDR